MSPTKPFFTRTGAFDSDLLAEVRPLAKLVAAVGIVSLAPILLQELSHAVIGRPIFDSVTTLASQFLLAVGAGLVLMYVVARGIALADG